MGYIAHNAIVVTSWDDELIEVAANQARELGAQVLGPSDEAVNGYRSILVCPDGSKEGWEASAEGDARRDKFVEWMAAQAYEDGSNALSWVEARYGSDDADATIVRHAWSKS